ncbi:MAG: hypothetical protein M8858_08135 [marine benthic group bacterium]|nr:hypothetical protein [Gemmatimonadota bacterium]
MSIERLLYFHNHMSSTLRGGKIIGDGSVASGAGPGGAGVVNSTDIGWHAAVGLHGKATEVESYGSVFGSNGYFSAVRLQNYYEFQSMFPPFPTGNRIYRIREIIGTDVSQAGSNNPLSKFFWGFTKNFQAETVLYEAGMIGFMGTWVGTTPGNWQAMICDESASEVHNVDTGISCVGPSSLRVDIDGPEGEIRFYIDEALESTYTVASGALGGTSGLVGGLGYGINPGWITGASQNTIATIYTDHLCLNGALQLDEVS